MSAIKIKICGIRDSTTAEFCLENGVDFLGFNFSPKSIRYISLKESEKIINNLHKKFINSKFELIALFFNTPKQEINDVINSDLFNSFQYVSHDIHFDRSSLNQKVRFIPQIGVQSEILDSDLSYSDDLLILDSFNKAHGGGSGNVFPWENVKQIKRKYLLAGGLTPENVSSALETLTPFGIDVASGVEDSPGIKNLDKIRRFIENARR